MQVSNPDVDDKIRTFLAEVIEVSEKLKFMLEHDSDSDEASELYGKRCALFEQPDTNIASWIKQNDLNASESWNTYKELLLLLEEEQDKRKYQVSNKVLSFETELKLEDKPFMIQEDDVSDKKKVDSMIMEKRMAKNDIIDLMSGINANELGKQLQLARKLSRGDFWERDYDL